MEVPEHQPNFERVVEVEYGSGVILFKVYSKESQYLIQDQIPLTERGEVKILAAKRVSTTIGQKRAMCYLVTKMELYDKEGNNIGVYNPKMIGRIEQL